MTRRTNRRDFLAQTASGVIASGFFINSSPAEDSDSPNERLNLAAVGATGRAGANISGCSSQNIVAVADVDANLLDKGCQKYPNARKYRDFRVMLEKEADKIDAVLVGTADHCHAPAASMALRLKKHTYCEKPLTHTVFEARTLANLAKENKLVTQMGTQIHSGDNYRRVVELVESGAIGDVREVHVWVGVNYAGRTIVKDRPKPAHVDWDLWLGPAPEKPYLECKAGDDILPIHPFNWRWFWDYGTGGLGDFGCHYMDLTHWALDLRNPTNVSATGPKPHPESTTAGLIVKYDYPARGKRPPVKLTWYDGGKQPGLLEDIRKKGPKDQNGKPMNLGSGHLFIGQRGMVVSNYGQHSVLPKGDAAIKRPEPYIPKSIGHHAEFLNAIKNGGETTCNFSYSGALTESVLLGVVAYRSGKSIEWDTKNLKITNSPEAQQLIHKEYRKGWTL